MWLIGLMYLIGFIKNIRSHKAIRSHKIKNINLSQRRQPFLPFYLFTFLPLNSSLKPSVAVDDAFHAFFHSLEIGIFVAQRNVVILEGSDHGVVAVGHDQTHLAVLLCYDGERLEVIDIHIAGAQEIVDGVEQDVALIVFHAEMAVLLKDLVKL